MKKIPTIFKRSQEGSWMVIPEPHPDCAWVFSGEGVATRKYDGTCCKVEGGKLWKRREVKPGRKVPPGFVEEQFDEVTGKRVGWVPTDPHDKQDRWHYEAFREDLPDGTYELCGPKVQGNPEQLDKHILIPHTKADVFQDCPRSFEGLKEWLRDKDIEGVVFHHPDGRMAKIKKRDFGFKRR